MKINNQAIRTDLVCPATVSDATALRQLSEQLGYSSALPDFEERLRLLIARDDQKVFLIKGEKATAGHPIAFIHAGIVSSLITPTRMHIYALVVDESARNRGLGAILVEAVESWASAMGIDLITVHSNVIRHAAHKFYYRLGFESVKEQKSLLKRLTHPA